MEPDAGTASETDDGPRAKAGVERLCVATRKVRPVADMIRFVVGPDGAVVPDVKCRLPGRGAWVTGTHAAVTAAVARNAFARSFRRQVAVPGDLAEATGRLLEQAALDALAIAGKAGLVVSGFAKVEVALARGGLAALVQAAEAAPDGVRKLRAAARRAEPEQGDVQERVTLPCLIFAGMQLDLALGRSNVIHAAVLAGPASATLLARWRSLDHFRGGEPDGPAVEHG